MALSLARLGTLVMFPKNSHREDKVSQYCPLVAEGDRVSTNCSPSPENPSAAKGHISLGQRQWNAAPRPALTTPLPSLYDPGRRARPELFVVAQNRYQ